MDKIIRNSDLSNKLEAIFGLEDVSKLPLETVLENICAYYENIISCMPGNVYWFDRNCKTLGANKNVLNMFGLKSSAEFVGLNFEEMGKLGKWSKEATQQFYSDTMRVLESGESRLNVEEPSIPHSDGRTIYFLTHRVPIYDKQGHVIGMVGISIDISERREHENALQASIAEAKQANESKDKFLEVIMTELRKPLNGILPPLQLARMNPDIEKVKEYIEIAFASSMRILPIIDDAKDLVCLEGQQIKFLKERIDIKKTIEDIIKNLYLLVSQKNIDIILNFDLDVPNEIISDSARFLQILETLLNNSIKYTECGLIIMSVELVLNKKVGQGHYIKFSIKDSGIGISKNKLDAINFNISSEVPSHKITEHGMHLSIISRLVPKLGGEFNIQSQLSRGTLVSFTLPSEKGPAGPMTDVQSKANILVIDGEFERASAFSKLLYEYNCQIIPEENLAVTLKGFEESNRIFEMVIVNETLQESNINISKIINSFDFLSKSLFIFLINPLFETYFKNYLLGSRSAFILKPVLPSCILKNVNSLYEKHIKFKPKVLLVEDEPFAQIVQKAMLEKLGCEVHLAGTINMALQLIKNNKFNIVFSDIELPDQSGEIIPALLSENCPDAPVKCIAVTVNASEALKEKYIELGFYDVFTKPIIYENLQNVLSALLATKN